MDSGPSQKSVVERLTGSWAIFVAIIASLTTVFTNLDKIRDSVDNFLGHAPARVEIVQPRLVFATFPEGLKYPASIPGYVYTEADFAGDLDGMIVIDLEKFRSGEDAAHLKFVELPEVWQLYIWRRPAQGDSGIVILSPGNIDDSVVATLRVVVKKDSKQAIKGCALLVNNPSEDVVTSFTRLDFEEGSWDNYFEFGFVFPYIPESVKNSKWSVVLRCESNGVIVGDGPKELETIGLRSS